MRILAINELTPGITLKDLATHMDGEIAQGKRFYEQGFIVEGYASPAFSTVYLIVESPSMEEAKTKLEQYPTVQAGLIKWNLYPLIGLPAIAQSLKEKGLSAPSWWPN